MFLFPSASASSSSSSHSAFERGVVARLRRTNSHRYRLSFEEVLDLFPRESLLRRVSFFAQVLRILSHPLYSSHPTWRLNSPSDESRIRKFIIFAETDISCDKRIDLFTVLRKRRSAATDHASSLKL